jgi:hypothetical protein
MKDGPLTADSEHGKRIREMARRETSPETRKKLDDLAAAWEQLCEDLTEEIAKRKAT